jgi:hypothetical protein
VISAVDALHSHPSNYLRSSQRTYGGRPTRSSIADVSDNGEYFFTSSDRFPSTERILQHPQTDLAGERQVIRKLKDSDRPVFLPKPRQHRVNGYPIDSIRDLKLISNATAKLPPQSHANHTGRRPARVQASAGFGLGWSQGQKTKTPLPPSKWHFSDSISNINVEEQHASTLASWSSPASVNASRVEFPAASKQKARSRTDPVAHQHSVLGLDGDNCTRTSADTSFDDGHHFSFNLIPLPQAALIQAERRASGQYDPTMSGNFSSPPSTGSQGKRFKRGRLPSIEWAGVRKAFNFNDKSRNGGPTPCKGGAPSPGAGSTF